MFFKQYIAVFKNSFKVCASDSFYLVISITMLAIMALAASMPSIGNEHIRLIRDQCHSIVFICAALACSFGLIRVVTDDIRRGAGSVLMSRPVSASVLMFGKLSGVLACTLLLVISGSVAALWISEIYFQDEIVNIGSFSLLASCVALSLLYGAGKQYLSGANFSESVSLSLCIFLIIGFAVRYFVGVPEQIDFKSLQSLILIFMALIIFASIVLIFSVVSDSAVVLAASIIIFFFGLLSEYICTVLIGGSLGSSLASIVPNWQMFWVLEKIGMGQEIPISYFFRSGIHAFLLSFMLYQCSNNLFLIG